MNSEMFFKFNPKQTDSAMFELTKRSRISLTKSEPAGRKPDDGNFRRAFTVASLDKNYHRDNKKVASEGNLHKKENYKVSAYEIEKVNAEDDVSKPIVKDSGVGGNTPDNKTSGNSGGKIASAEVDSVGKVVESGKDTTNSSVQKAVALIENSLKEISDKLGLNISVSDKLDKIDLSDPSDAVLEQLSEILASLKGITDLLGKAADDEVTLDINGIEIKPEESAVLEDELSSNIFKIELAMNSLGIGGDVQVVADEKLGKSEFFTGIPVAVDPSKLSMSKNQLKKVIGDLVEVDEKKIAEIIEKMSKLAKSAQAVKGETEADVSVDQIKTGEVSKATQESLNLSGVDSKVMRKLLKIDATEGKNNLGSKEVVVSSKESTDTSEKDISKLLSADKLPTGKDDSSVSLFVKNITKSVELNSVKGSSLNSEISGVEGQIKSETKFSGIVQRLDASFKSVEQNVLSQVTQRFNYAVKNGVHEVRLMLKPESLGNVRITIQVEGDVVAAKIHVENQQVKQIIESNLQQLKNSLEENNMRAGSFDVNVNQQFSHDGGFEEKRGSGSTHSAGENLVESETNSAENVVKTGVETGRRFGSNSMEFFA